MERRPVLTGALLTLRPLESSDFEALYAAGSDPLIWEQHPAKDRWRREEFEKFFAGAMESGGALAAVENASGRIVGTSRFHGYDEAASEVEIGWTFLERRCWGGAYNSEMKRLMVAHALRYVKTVIFLVGFDNMRSQRAVLKLGAEAVAPRLDVAGIERAAFAITRAPAVPA